MMLMNVYRQEDIAQKPEGVSSDKDPFPLVPDPPLDDESAREAASVLDESTERPAEVSEVWWRRLNEVSSNP